MEPYMEALSGAKEKGQVRSVGVSCHDLGALKTAANYYTARDLLGVYLGADAGRRVMSGDILRGSVDKIRTAILYFDLQGFTKLSSRRTAVMC